MNETISILILCSTTVYCLAVLHSSIYLSIRDFMLMLPAC